MSRKSSSHIEREIRKLDCSVRGGSEEVGAQFSQPEVIARSWLWEYDFSRAFWGYLFSCLGYY